MNKRVSTSAVSGQKKAVTSDDMASQSSMRSKRAVATRRKRAVPGALLTPQEAFREVVLDYGPEALARELVMKVGVLYNKCDADDDTHNKPTLADVVRVTRLTGDMRILDALDHMFHRAAYDVTPGLQVSDQALLELLCKVGSKNGSMQQALAKGLEDNELDHEEMRAIRAEAFDLITAVLTFTKRCEGLVSED